jgi:hypothetical protein
MNTKIEITFPNGEVYMVPAEVVAKSRTEYYAGKDGFKNDSAEWFEEFEQSMKPMEILDWMGNNMDWVDIKDHAIKKEKEAVEPDYDKMWFEVRSRVIESL